MEYVLELRCQLEQGAMIKQIMFGGMVCAAIQLVICMITIIRYEDN
jgi:hypothetical protein